MIEEVKDTEASARKMLVESISNMVTSYMHAMTHIENAVNNLRADLAVAKAAANGELKKVEAAIDNMKTVGVATSVDFRDPDRPYGGGWERMQSEIDALRTDVNQLLRQVSVLEQRVQPDEGHWCTQCRGEWDGVQSRNSHCPHVTAELDAVAKPPDDPLVKLNIGDLVVYDREHCGLKYVGTLEDLSDPNSGQDARVRYYKDDMGCPRFWAPLRTLQPIDLSLVERFHKVKASVNAKLEAKPVSGLFPTVP